MNLTIGLAVALALSLIGNAFLGWQWAGAKAQCRADMEKAARIAIDRERDKAEKNESQAVDISTTIAAATSEAVRNAIGDTHDRRQTIRNVVVSGACRMPDGLPSLQPAVDEANAAAGL